MAISEKATKFIADSFERGRAIPGQSLTNAPQDAYNWEKPTEFTNPKETMYYLFETLTVPETTTNLLLSLSNGVGVIDIASSVLYSGFLEGKWNPDLMTLMMEPTMYMIMALAEKAEIDYVLDSADDENTKEMSPEKQLETLQVGINELDNIRKQAVDRVNPQSVPEEIREVIEETELPQSLLDKVEKEKSSSLLAREE
tara:strand:- start:2768 stop:3364 length:597 start_codon:yes stop_codon:yes gene_type:complete